MIPDGFNRVNPSDVVEGDEVWIKPGPGTEPVGPLKVENISGELLAIGESATIALNADGIDIYARTTVVEHDPVITEEFDDMTRTVTIYADGVATGTRPYTQSENENADAAEKTAADAATQAAIEAALVAAMDALQLIINETNATINSNPAPRIKDLARVQRRLIRIITKRFDGTA